MDAGLPAKDKGTQHRCRADVIAIENADGLTGCVQAGNRIALEFMTSAFGDTFNPPKVKVLDAMIGKQPNGGSMIGRAQLDFTGRSPLVHWQSNLLCPRDPMGTRD